MAYQDTPVVLYRTTQHAAFDPRIELASLRDGVDITVRRIAPATYTFELEERNGRRSGYSLSPQETNHRVRRPEADEVGEPFVKRDTKDRWLRGRVYRLPAGTPLPPHFNGIADGSQHHTIFTTAQVPVIFLDGLLFFNEAIRDLPWQQVEGDFLIKANADVPGFEDGMDPDTYDLALALHQAFDLLVDAADTDLAVELQYRIIEAGFPPVTVLEVELKRQCYDLLRKAGVVFKFGSN